MRGPKENDHSSERRAREARDEFDLRHVFPAETVVIGDEQIDLGRCRARQLYRIRRSNRPIRANTSIGRRNVGVEAEYRNPGIFQQAEITEFEVSCTVIYRLHQNLSESQRARVQAVATRRHASPDILYAIGQSTAVFDQINEEVCVPEDSCQWLCSPSAARNPWIGQ